MPPDYGTWKVDDSGNITLLMAVVLSLVALVGAEVRRVQARRKQQLPALRVIAQQAKMKKQQAGHGGLAGLMSKVPWGATPARDGRLPVPLEDPDEGRHSAGAAAAGPRASATLGGGKGGLRMGPDLVVQTYDGAPLQRFSIDTGGVQTLQDLQDAVADACEQSLSEYDQLRVADLVMQCVDAGGVARTVTAKMKTKLLKQAQELRLVPKEVAFRAEEAQDGAPPPARDDEEARAPRMDDSPSEGRERRAAADVEQAGGREQRRRNAGSSGGRLLHLNEEEDEAGSTKAKVRMRTSRA